ncbi:MAG: FAD-dependent oxidoreductase [Campylobacterales bacterium]|nr:FAD-dependent oxidoreductase [Campylobacterales bacterium]
MSAVYDTIIIGAGIAGSATAYFLSQKGQKVLIIDKKGIASGGSGAAGAFVSPKIGKGGPLQSLTNEAFSFAKDFYLKHFPAYYHQSGVVRIPKDEEDAAKFSSYEPFNENSFTKLNVEELKELGIKVPFESFFFPEAGACDAPDMCRELLKGIDYIQYEIKEFALENGIWQLGDYQAKNVVLATGYENSLFDMRYMGVKGTWGTRGDFRSNLPLKVSMHQSMSVSANIDGMIRLGATHEKSIKVPVVCQDEQALGLKEKASTMVDTSDLELVETFCGMRAGSRDYFPLVGRVIDVPFMLETYPSIIRGATPELKYMENLYICNGLGGRGFVFGPLMGKYLAEYIIDGKGIDKRVNPDRLFFKWCRKILQSK